MNLYILSYFVCAVSLTHSLSLFKPHLLRHKCIINRRLHWMPLKLELFSRETTCLLATVISTVSLRVAVTSLPSVAIKGSARIRQDVTLTGRSPIRAGHARNRPITINGRSIGASLEGTKLAARWILLLTSQKYFYLSFHADLLGWLVWHDVQIRQCLKKVNCFYKNINAVFVSTRKFWTTETAGNT